MQASPASRFGDVVFRSEVTFLCKNGLCTIGDVVVLTKVHPGGSGFYVNLSENCLLSRKLVDRAGFNVVLL